MTGSQLLAIVADRGVPVSELSKLERMPQILVNVTVERKLPFEDLPQVSKELAHAHEALENRGRILLRY